MSKEDPKVVISRDAALAAIGALSMLERIAGIDKKSHDAMEEIMDALAHSAKKPS